MDCNQAKQLFDAFLAGELSVPLATELGAHRVSCADCRRALALLEITGHILATDEDPVRLKSNFTDRLLACVDKPIGRFNRLMRRTIYIGGPMAAAAVVALAFLGGDLQRASVLLFYRYEVNCQEIARVLELPVATVKSHLHRARNRLREMLEQVTEKDLRHLRNRTAVAG